VIVIQLGFRFFSSGNVVCHTIIATLLNLTQIFYHFFNTKGERDAVTGEPFNVRNLGILLLLQCFVTVANLYLEKSSRREFLQTKTMEKNIRENVDLKKTLNFLPDGVVILDTSTKQVKFINKFANKLFKVPYSTKEGSQDSVDPEQEQGQGAEQRPKQECTELHERCLFEPFIDSLVTNPLEKTRLREKMKKKKNVGNYSLDDLVKNIYGKPEYEPSGDELDESSCFGD